MIWNQDQNDIIKRQFIDFIEKGASYPNKSVVDLFFKKHPEILQDDDQKLSKLRVKLNNSKKLFVEKKKKIKRKTTKI